MTLPVHSVPPERTDDDRSGRLIERVQGRQILDSRGHPTVEAEVTLASGARGRAAVPVGSSTGRYEALEVRDGGQRWGGKGVHAAIANIEDEIARDVLGLDADDQVMIDALLIELDGTSSLVNLGCNSILGVSLAVARAAAAHARKPLWRHLYTGQAPPVLPTPMVSVLDGGVHADNRLLVQEFILIPTDAPSFSEGLRMCAETYDELGHKLLAGGLSRAVGEIGGYAAQLDSTEDALDLLLAAITTAGYEPGVDIAIALDVAASELIDTDQEYRHEHEAEPLSTEEMIVYWIELCERYPIVSLEDPLGEEDWPGWRELTQRLGRQVQLVGDDLFVTHQSLLELGIEQRAANAVLVKPNQVGTLTRTLDMIELAHTAGYKTVMAHRSGDTEDTTIADLAVATGCDYVKFGAPARSERTAKYNRLLRIQEQLAAERV
ncbi:MAG TPA: phosphopyruvate hydratase [Solirubrobacteraceae bacterium]|nr:phosphopyruvate hydratase [Solirubrobacteraceae bacterium]